MSILPVYLFVSPSDPDGTRAHTERAARDSANARLVASLREGSEHALEDIIRMYRAPLTAFVQRMVRSSAEDAADVLQRVFLRLWVNRATLDGETSLRAYLFTAARNHALNSARTAHRDRANVTLTDEVATISAVDVELEARDLAEAVYRAIDALPPRGREIFLLSREGGLSYPEIAAATGVSVNTVKTHMTRALASIAKAAAPFLD